MSIPEKAREIAAAVRSGSLKAVDVLEEAFRRIEKENNRIRAFASLDNNAARKQAEEVDRLVASGKDPGLLAGVPVGLKDNLCTVDHPTTCGSRMLRSYHPPYDATVVSRLRRAGALFPGKTNMDEFAMGSSTETSAFGPTRNPADPDRAPGGSSGGSAAAVAARFCPVALGSDTGGSIRQPASLTGTVGFKPTYGRVSRYGLVAFGSSLDQIGPFASDVQDAALLMSVIAGHDERDGTSFDAPPPDWLQQVEGDVKGLRIGVPEEYFQEGLDSEVREKVETALARMESLGALRVPLSLPMIKAGIATYYIVAPCEASSNLARYDGVHYGHRAEEAKSVGELLEKTRAEGFGPEVTRRIILGTFALSSGYYDAYYLRALKVRRKIADEFARAFEKCDVIAGPTSPAPAFSLGEKLDDPLSMYLCDVFTVTANLAGLPAVSVPCGKTGQGLPVGLQFQGAFQDDAGVLRAARAWEQEAGTSPLE